MPLVVLALTNTRFCDIGKGSVWNISNWSKFAWSFLPSKEVSREVGHIWCPVSERLSIWLVNQRDSCLSLSFEWRKILAGFSLVPNANIRNKFRRDHSYHTCFGVKVSKSLLRTMARPVWDFVLIKSLTRRSHCKLARLVCEKSSLFLYWYPQTATSAGRMIWSFPGFATRYES